MMRLSDFILVDMELILTEWEAFAGTLLPAASNLNALALRDHAPQILEAIAHDLTTPQSEIEQSEKSKCRAPEIVGAPETAAQSHAVLRARGGFDIIQLVAEYRALRASVLRRWTKSAPLEPSAAEDIIRFNEAIDQAVAESVGHFHVQVETARNLLLGMLGHDMRSPLNTIVMTASYLEALNAGEEVSAAAACLIRSGASIQALIDDLVDFNRTRLGLGIRIAPSETDLARAVTDELEQLRAAHPDRLIVLETSGDCRGYCDGPRLQQSVRNLVSNAILYGAPNTPVQVAIRADESAIRLEVSNSGAPIDPALAHEMFDPLKRGLAQPDQRVHQNLGLGLFIVREISRAHGGDVALSCCAGTNTFTIQLPRTSPPESPAPSA